MARGRIHLKIGGTKRFLKFTIATFKRYDKKQGQDGSAISLLMGNPLVALLDLTEEALNYPEATPPLPEDFNTEMLSDWIDDLPVKDLEVLTDTMMESLKKYAAAFGGQEPKETDQK
jgi:hypothetical protein